jgi:hypothetical protein
MAAVFAFVLIASVAVLQALVIDTHCTYGNTLPLELGSLVGLAGTGTAALLTWTGRPFRGSGLAGGLPVLATMALALILLVSNRGVGMEFLFDPKPCAPIEYEDGVRYRTEHAVIGVGYAVAPAFLAVIALVALRRPRVRKPLSRTGEGQG